jgi:hypothetical protein
MEYSDRGSEWRILAEGPWPIKGGVAIDKGWMSERGKSKLN